MLMLCGVTMIALEHVRVTSNDVARSKQLYVEVSSRFVGFINLRVPSHNFRLKAYAVCFKNSHNCPVMNTI